jgi:CRP-like cAMP-binding protein
VSIFKTIEPYERLLLADAIQEHTYKANELIIEQGCDSQNLMFLVSGVAIATKLNFKS